MSVVMHRSFAEAMGFEWPRELAAIVNGERVTWADVRAGKIERQRKRLAQILRIDQPCRQAAHVWVFNNPQDFPYGGWWCYIRTLRNAWCIRQDDSLAAEIMAMFPCGLLPLRENFRAWQQEFARTYARPGRRKQGMVAGWVEVNNYGHKPERFIGVER